VVTQMLAKQSADMKAAKMLSSQSPAIWNCPTEKLGSVMQVSALMSKLYLALLFAH